MSGSYGALNAKYNTIYALYLQLQQDISGGNTLQEVLDAGNTANNKTIQLTSAGGETNYSSTAIQIIGNAPATTTLNNESLSSSNVSTGKSYSISPDVLTLSGSSGTNYTSMGDGLLSMTDLDGKFVGLSPTLLNFNGNTGNQNQVLTKDAITNAPVWADLPLSQIPDLSGVLNIGAIASKSIDMNNFDITNIKSLDISTAPVATPELNFTRTSIPIVVDGVTYYIGLFTVPP
jgi:hypothetical protein